MVNFKILDDLPKRDLYYQLEIMLKHKTVQWKNNQICVNTISNDPDNIHLGVGSLFYDWDKSKTVIDELGIARTVAPERPARLMERDFDTLASPFKGTLFEEVYEALVAKYQIGRVRIMKSNPGTCLSWHMDDTCRVHYPIKTQPGCLMVIEDEVKHLDLNTWWFTNTLGYHTAFNASSESRIHLVAEILN